MVLLIISIERGCLNVERHKHWVNWSWFRIYFGGNGALFEIDFGPRGKDFAIFLFTKNNGPITKRCYWKEV
jgi:hypothetical protein